jgi:hypothetical protein
MPNKNTINQILQIIDGKIKIQIFFTFCINWGYLLKKHQQASMKGAIINHQLQLTNNK